MVSPAADSAIGYVVDFRKWILVGDLRLIICSVIMMVTSWKMPFEVTQHSAPHHTSGIKTRCYFSDPVTVRVMDLWFGIAQFEDNILFQK